jgi:PhnB protein
MPDVKPIPDSYPRVSPHLSVAGAADAIDFYKSVFGATERIRMGMPDGTVAHAELELGGSVIMIGEEMPGGVDPSPKTLGGSPVALFVYDEDVDDIFQRAFAARAQAVRAGEPLLRRPRRDARRPVRAPAGTSRLTSRTFRPTRCSGAPPRRGARPDTPRLPVRLGGVVADHGRGVQVLLCERECFLDAQSAAPEHDDQRA